MSRSLTSSFCAKTKLLSLYSFHGNTKANLKMLSPQLDIFVVITTTPVDANLCFIFHT